MHEFRRKQRDPIHQNMATLLRGQARRMELLAPKFFIDSTPFSETRAMLDALFHGDRKNVVLPVAPAAPPAKRARTK